MGHAEAVVRQRLVEDSAARPGVGGEDEMAQRLGERPLVVDPFVASRFGQQLGARDSSRPETFERAPHRAVVVGGLHLSELHTLWVPLVQLGLDEGSHVDVVDGEVAN